MPCMHRSTMSCNAWPDVEHGEEISKLEVQGFAGAGAEGSNEQVHDRSVQSRRTNPSPTVSVPLVAMHSALAEQEAREICAVAAPGRRIVRVFRLPCPA